MKAGRREEEPFARQEAPLVPGAASLDDAWLAEMHGERGRVSLTIALAILARHHQTGRQSAVARHIDVLTHYTDPPRASGCEWQTIPLTLGALREWLGY
jgi:hypothetical protein